MNRTHPEFDNKRKKNKIYASIQLIVQLKNLRSDNRSDFIDWTNKNAIKAEVQLGYLTFEVKYCKF